MVNLDFHDLDAEQDSINTDLHLSMGKANLTLSTPRIDEGHFDSAFGRN